MYKLLCWSAFDFWKIKFKKIKLDELDFLSILNLTFTACVACLKFKIDKKSMQINEG